MKHIRKLYHVLRSLMVMLIAPADFHSAKRKLLLDNTVSVEEKALLNEVTLQVHRKDGMYIPLEARHYLSVGLSAIRCIETALDKSNETAAVRTILDFPCGKGRVLRFLRVRFPDAEITAAELDIETLDFCNRMFSVKPLLSDIDFRKLKLSGKFDLIWCGSLVTHINENATIDLLRFFHDHLSPGGLCVFTAHGLNSVDGIRDKSQTYGLTSSAQATLLSQFHQRRYGYADYKNHRGYGISVVSHERMLAITLGIGRWNETSFLEQGWDSHHDVYGFTLPSS